MLRIRRRSATLDLLTDADTTAWVCARGRGFFSFEGDIARQGNLWLVVGGLELAPARRDYGLHETSQPSGETCRFLVSPETRTLVVDLPPGPWRQLFVLRAIRDILRWELQSERALFLHGACVAASPHGVCILGRSGSGKSSLSYALTRGGKWSWVTEDDICILETSAGWEVLGWPGSVRLRRSGVHLFPELQTVAKRLTHPANPLEAQLPTGKGMLRVFPEELSDLFGTVTEPECMLSAFFVLDPDAPLGCLEAVSPSSLTHALHLAWDVLPERRAGARVSEALEGMRSWSDMVFHTFLLASFGEPDITYLGERLERLAATIPAWRIDRTALLKLQHPNSDLSRMLDKAVGQKA